jgi:hypothetical protein
MPRLILLCLLLTACSQTNYVAEPLRANPDEFNASVYECTAYSKEEFGKRGYHQGYTYCMAKKGWRVSKQP